MKRKNYSIKTVAASFMAGALIFSALGFATASNSIEVDFGKISFFVKGQNKTSADGIFKNGDTSVPEALIYQGTTYIPVRKAAELLGEPVYWEGTAHSVSIGKPTVTLYDGKGQSIGTATLTAVTDGVSIAIEVSGLSPGKHGFHIHDKAFEGFDFKTAGGHFNPGGKKHGLNNADGHHVGDLPNLVVGADGKARFETVIKGATLEKDGAGSLLGHSIIIHAGEDDGKTDPAGNSGDRIAGGNIPK